MRLSSSRSILFVVPALGAVAAVIYIAVAGWARAPATPRSAPGTERMAAILRGKWEAQRKEFATLPESAAQERWYCNSPESIPAIHSALAQSKTFEAQVNLRFRLARELLWCGKNEDALQTLGELRRGIESVRDKLPPEQGSRLAAAVRDLAAIGYFRMAEVDNCLCSQGADSCLFPIRQGGIHSQPRGARGAIGILTECLQIDPTDLGSRWLLNLAYMTLGEHPANVPPEWLLPESIFASEHDIGRFRNVARERGVDRLGLAGGCVLEDFDGDARLDIVTSGWSLEEQLKFYRNRGDGSFEDRTEPAGLTGLTGGLNLSHADYNNDGFADVLVLRGAWLGDRGSYPHSLLRGNGDGTFDDVTQEAGLLSFHPGQVGVWSDYDNDGWVDLFIGNEDSGDGSHPSLLYHNSGDGTFTECAAACGLTGLGFVKGAAWGDYDNDNLPDLYVSRMGNTNLLFHNEGPGKEGGRPAWKFKDVTAAAGVAQPQFSFSSWFFDYDNDGWLDLFVAGFKLCQPREIVAMYLGQPHASEVPRLYRNNRDGTFADVTREVKLDRAILAMGANFGDLDNDGFPDIYLGTGAPDLRVLLPNRMFRNDGGKRFQDVTTSGGFGHLQKGHGIAFGDLDGDGDQDVYAVLGGWYTADVFRNCLFENPGHGNHWITLRLRGTRTHRAAIGARIKVTVEEPPGRRDIHATVSTGGSFGSSSLQQEIGLGAAQSIAAIEVTWPATGRKQVLTGVAMDRVLEIREE